MSYFQEIAEKEEVNFQKNRAKFAEHYLLLEDCESAYRLFLNNVIDLRKASHAEVRYFDCLKVCIDIPNELSLAVLALFREHLGDSSYHIRKAIELFGFASLMSKGEADAAKWRKAAVDEAAYSEYRKAFSTRKLFPFEDQGLRLLYEQYDFSSKDIHSSIFSIDEHLVSTRKDGSKVFGSSTFTADLPALRFKGHANGIVLTHGLILTMLPRLFEKFVNASVQDEFDSRVAGLLERTKPLNEETSGAYGLEPPIYKKV